MIVNVKIKIIFLILILIIPSTKVNAENLTTKMIQEEKERLGINDFLEETKKYTDNFFDDINIIDSLNSALIGKIDNKSIFNRIFKLFGKEVVSSLKTIIS